MIRRKYRILETIRLQRDLTYDELAAEIGISKMTLFNIMTHRTEPMARNQFKIRQWLDSSKGDKKCKDQDSL